MSSPKFRRRAFVSLVAALACGGDNGTGPTPPGGSTQQVPRVLSLATVNGAAPPARIFLGSDGFETKAVGGSATLQTDSMLVVRIDATGVGGSTTFTSAGLLDATGRALFYYTSGPPDSARVLGDGSVTAWITLDGGTDPSRTSVYVFSRPYTGPALNPMPLVNAISPAVGLQYGPDTTLVLSGTGFMPGTQVKWGTEYLTVTYESENRITARLPANLLTSAGTVQITVGNPSPGGGERLFNYKIVLPAPVLTSLSPASIPAGGGDFTLHLYGSYFPPGTTVLWNGTPRQGYWRSPQDLVVYVSASEIQTAGTIQVAVRTGAPGGGTSASLPLAVTGAPAKKLAEVATRFDAATLVADPIRPLVYAGAGIGESSYGPTSHPHSVVAIDPVAGTIVWAISLPKEVGSLAVSDDGQFLYVGESGAPTILRIALATHTIDMTVTLPNPSTQPRAITVSPGNPHTFAVTRACSGCSPVVGPLAIYDDSVPRQDVAPSGPSPIAFLDPTHLYGTEGSGVYTYAVTATGVTPGTQLFSAVAGPYTLVGGRVYASLGGIYDVTTHASATFYPLTGSVGGVVPSTDRATLYGIDANGGYLRAFDAKNGVELAAIPMDVGVNGSGYAIRWGADGIVFAGNGSVMYVRADFIH